MKTIVHYGYDLTPRVNVEKIDDCVLDNTREAVIRVGKELFTSYYPVEWCYNVCHRIDPTRSLAREMLMRLSCRCDLGSKWPTCDIIHYLLRDLGLAVRLPKHYEVIAFWTMFPTGVAECLAESYLRNDAYLSRYENCIRVINNPFFHADPNASERRLVEIGEVNGLRYAVDRTQIIASPMALADEMTLLNEGLLDNAKTLMVRNNLWRSISGILEDNGLCPAVEG